jgi:hypothetical protein
MKSSDKSLIDKLVTFRSGLTVKVLDVAKSRFGDIFWFRGGDDATMWAYVHEIESILA